MTAPHPSVATTSKPANRLTALEARELMGAGSLTSEELVQSCLDRIRAREDAVQAWSYVDWDGALERARECDRTASRGPLHGIPVGIKDIVDTADMPTELGEPEIYAGRQPERDATLVQHLRESGAVIVGKTAPSKHTIMLPGKTRNPHDPTRSPGASSSGSAAAVADYMVPLAVCSQTAGSILRPATYCGVVGFKPTKDTVVYDGTRTYSPHLDTLGSMARSVPDAALLMQAMTGEDRFDAESVEAGDLTVGLYRTPYFESAEGYVREHYDRSTEALVAAGVTVREAEMPKEFDELSELQDVIMSYDLDKVFAEHRRDHLDLLDPELIAYCEKGSQVTEAQYQAALDHAEVCRGLLDSALGDLDVLLLPSTLTDAPPISTTGTSEFIRIWTFLHTPAINLPTGTSPAGLPLSVQLVGRIHGDARLLAVAAKVDEILGRPENH
jgi:Asp-tRNA(Asn)/Glu-tRNA(Gln) amidotransferase A subunit family amidase